MPTSSPRPPNPATPAPETTGKASFTGKYSDSGYGAAADGLYQFLKVDVEIDVTQAGSLGFMPVLLDAGGSLVAAGDLYAGFDRQAPLLSAQLDQGVQTVSIYFNGPAIRQHGVDGPYSVGLQLTDQKGDSLAETHFATAPYDHLKFRSSVP